MVEGEVEVGAGEAAERADEGEEDGDEDEVCAQGAEEEDEADETLIFYISYYHSPSFFFWLIGFTETGGGRKDVPIKMRKKAKLELKAGISRPAGLPGFPMLAAAATGSVT